MGEMWGGGELTVSVASPKKERIASIAVTDVSTLRIVARAIKKMTSRPKRGETVGACGLSRFIL